MNVQIVNSFMAWPQTNQKDVLRSMVGHYLSYLFSTFLPCVTKHLLYSSSLQHTLRNILSHKLELFDL